MLTFNLDDTVAAERTLQALILLLESHIDAGKAIVGAHGQVIYDPGAVKECTVYTKIVAYIRYLDEEVYNNMSKKVNHLLGRK